MSKKLKVAIICAIISALAVIGAALITSAYDDFTILSLMSNDNESATISNEAAYDDSIIYINDFTDTYKKTIAVKSSIKYKHHIDLTVTEKPAEITTKIIEIEPSFWQKIFRRRYSYYILSISLDDKWLENGVYTLEITGEGEDGLVRSTSRYKLDIHHAVSITTPENHSHIPEIVTIEGTLNNEQINGEYTLCIVAYSPEKQRYYPLSIPEIDENGEWSTVIDFSNEQFSELSELKILALRANNTAARAYQDYLDQQDQTGWETLYNGSRVSGSIDVTLEPDARIINLENNATVDIRQQVEGVAKHIGNDSVYIVTYSYDNKAYYPLKIYDISPIGKWTNTLFFGDESTGGAKYRLMLVTADTNTSIVYDNYIEECDTQQSWPGMKELPDDTTIMCEFDVIRTTPDVYITNPSDGSQVNMQQEVEGIALDIGDDSTVFTVLYSYDARAYYPLRVYDISPSGEWVQTINFGNEQDAGKRFKLMLVIAKDDTVAYYEDYLSECDANQSWPGMKELPDGTLIIDTVEVRREASLAEGSITYPDVNVAVDMQETVKGTVYSIQEDTDIYIILYICELKRYYPQGSPDLNDDGDWSYDTSIGGVQGDEYILFLIAAPTSTAETYQSYLEESESNQSWEGMDTLPDGSQIIDSVLVTRE